MRESEGETETWVVLLNLNSVCWQNAGSAGTGQRASPVKLVLINRLGLEYPGPYPAQTTISIPSHLRDPLCNYSTMHPEVVLSLGTPNNLIRTAETRESIDGHGRP